LPVQVTCCHNVKRFRPVVLRFKALGKSCPY
jgi:hypothetical protein